MYEFHMQRGATRGKLFPNFTTEILDKILSNTRAYFMNIISLSILKILKWDKVLSVCRQKADYKHFAFTLRGFQKDAVQCPSKWPVQYHWCHPETSWFIGLDQRESKMTTLSIRKRLHAADCCMTSWEWERVDISGVLCWFYLWCMAEITSQSSQVCWRVWAKWIHLYFT